MRKKIGELYRRYCPLFIRRWNVNRKEEKMTGSIKREIQEYYKMNDYSEEIGEILDYWKANPCRIFNYKFIDKYIYQNSIIYHDEKSGFPYIIHQGKKMYFKKTMSDEQINAYYNSICMEQDDLSPHHYFTSFEKENKKLNTVVDIGGAEGNFSLEIVEHAEKIYIFECDNDWIEPLKLTFEPWKEKVSIISEYVSKKDSKKTKSLDSILEKEENIDVIKMDVEGGELEVLQGASKILKRNNKSLVFACVYHKQQQEKEILAWAQENEYECEYNKGYMLFLYDEKGCYPPYFRRGVVRLTSKEDNKI